LTMSEEKPKAPKPEQTPPPIAKPAEPANVIIREGEAPDRNVVRIDRPLDDNKS
jgi:hypothetical protein